MTDVKSGKASFMHTNMIPNTDAGITASSQASGTTSRPQKEGAGAANAVLGGTYSGQENLDYYIEIETTGEIGAATFRWSDDGGVTFNATGVTTSTSPISLNNGVTVQWTQGSGNDVVLADIWRFKAYLPYHRQNVLDRDRDTEWRSTAVSSESLQFNLGSAQQPTTLVILDHNLTGSASITLQSSSSAGFGAITGSWVIPWQTGRMLYFLDPLALVTAQHWRILLADSGNTDGYLRISEVFLGAHTRPDLTFDLGDFRGRIRAGQRDRSLSGKYYGMVNAELGVFDLTFVRLTQTQRDEILAIFDALIDLVNRQVLPVFLSPMNTDLSQVYLCEWEGGQAVASSETDAPERYSIPIKLCEAPRTLALTS